MGLVAVGIASLFRLITIQERNKPLVIESKPQVSQAKTQEPAQVSGIERPGCTAADEALVVHGHLTGLSKGWGGFGVLKISRDRLSQAAEAAKIAGDPELSQKFSRIASKLPDIHTPEAANHAARELEPLLSRAWELGKHCKIHGGVSQEEKSTPYTRELNSLQGTPEKSRGSPRAREPVLDLTAVRAMAKKVQAGEITKEQAVQQLREQLVAQRG